MDRVSFTLPSSLPQEDPENHTETEQQFWPAVGGAGLPVEWPQPGEHQRGWVGCSPGRSWSQSDERRGGSDPFQLELGPHPCPAVLNLGWSRTHQLSAHTLKWPSSSLIFITHLLLLNISYLAYFDWCPHRSRVQNPHCPNPVPKSLDSCK